MLYSAEPETADKAKNPAGSYWILDKNFDNAILMTISNYLLNGNGIEIIFRCLQPVLNAKPIIIYQNPANISVVFAGRSFLYMIRQQLKI